MDISLVGELTSDNSSVLSFEVEKNIDLANESERIIPSTVKFDSSVYTTAANNSYSYASYEPEDESSKHPLVIWLHGGGEGGTDVQLPLLGNKVTSLVSDEFQDTMGEAYILVPQCPTFWMDDGTRTYVHGFSDPELKIDETKDSMYVQDLGELIKAYVNDNENIDRDRIIIGGCSNGGYMTMRMILEDMDYYAAAYFSSEAYRGEVLTDEDVDNLTNSKIGMYFVYCETDTNTPPSLCTIPTYDRLKEAGKDNLHLASFETVRDTSGLYFQEDAVTPVQYDSHWSWVYFFNNEVVSDDDSTNMWMWLSEQSQAGQESQGSNTGLILGVAAASVVIAVVVIKKKSNGGAS